MSTFKTKLESDHPDYASSGLYFGYMDMTYFAFTPQELKRRNLKIAIVYLHQENRFELWLGGGSRKVQAEYIGFFKGIDLGDYRLSQVSPGVDSIIESIISVQPDFENADLLSASISGKVTGFVLNICGFLLDSK